MSKALKDAVETMKVLDETRVNMVLRREKPEYINAISRLYLRARRKVNWDLLKEYVRQ